jgi:hypothetical protein
MLLCRVFPQELHHGSKWHITVMQAASAEQRRVQVLTREDASGGTHSREGTPAPEDEDEEEEEEEDDTAEVGFWDTAAKMSYCRLTS